MVFFKEVHSCPSQKIGFVGSRFDFLKCISNHFIESNMGPDDFLDVGESSGTHFRHSINVRSNLRKNNFFHFFENFCFTFNRFWLQNEAKLSTKFLKMSIFQK